MLIRSDVLVAKENDKMVQQGLTDFTDGVVAQVLTQINAANFRTERAGDGADVESMIHFYRSI
jgi:hypothetical protein